jgi:hypothetical protein
VRGSGTIDRAEPLTRFLTSFETTLSRKGRGYKVRVFTTS